MKITFFGTGSMLPTKERNPISVLLSYDSEYILFDCGEGTQRQMKIAGFSPSKVTRIFLSHWHGDHLFGLPGLLLTMAAAQPDKKLELYGPKHSKQRFELMQQLYIREDAIAVAVHEVGAGKFFENDQFLVEALPLDHTTAVVGYSFIEKDSRKINVDYLKKKYGFTQHPLLKQLQQGKDIVWEGKKIKAKDATFLQKGRKITFITDTAVCPNIVKLAKHADVLICEATHLDELKEKSKKFKHLTAKQAALLAKQAKVKKLVLFHYSQRYRDLTPFQREAEQYFKNTVCADDFFVVDVLR
ncbi:MAG: ribonuclease Z [Nanoarchaeota archaeon]